MLPCGKKECKFETCSLDTFCIYGFFKSRKWDFNHHIVPPISSSIAFRLESTKRGYKGFEEFSEAKQYRPIYIYDRLGEPTRCILEENLAHLERGEVAVSFSSGMAAVSSCILALTSYGDEIISHNTIYGCTYSLMTNWLPRFGLHTKFIDLTVPENLKNNITNNTKIVYFETPSNPLLQIIDIKGIVNITKQKSKNRKIYVVVDNTFATPLCQRPREFGADFVIHSLSKNICGFGTDLGGVIISTKKFWKDLLLVRKDFGGVLSSKSAWSILVYGLSSLPTRIKRQQETALEVAKFLENHNKVEKVLYPGLSSFPQYELAKKQMRSPQGEFAPGILIYFLLKATPQSTRKFLNTIARKSYSMTLAVSLGQVRTLIESPYLMTHATLSKKEKETMGIDKNGIRLSIGLEDSRDIIYDLELAFKTI